MCTAAQAPQRANSAAAAPTGAQSGRLANAIARRQADMARARSERPARIAAQRQAALYRELACEGRA